MQVQKEIREHHDNSIAPVNRHRMTKDALPNLGFGNDFDYSRHNAFQHAMIVKLQDSHKDARRKGEFLMNHMTMQCQ
jgi:hypothetical protein